MNVDLASITAHKMYGPKGVGALYVRRSKPRVRLVGADGRRRSRARHALGHAQRARHRRLRQGRRDRASRSGATTRRASSRCASACVRSSFAALDEVHLNGADDPHRLPGNLNVSFAFVEGEAMMMAIKDVAVSSRLRLHQRQPRAELRAARDGRRRRAGALARSASASAASTPKKRSTTWPTSSSSRCKRLREMSPLYEMHKEGIDLKSDPVGSALRHSSSPLAAREREGERHGVQRQSHRALREPAQRRHARQGRPERRHRPRRRARLRRRDAPADQGQPRDRRHRGREVQDLRLRLRHRVVVARDRVGQGQDGRRGR